MITVKIKVNITLLKQVMMMNNLNYNHLKGDFQCIHLDKKIKKIRNKDD